MTSLNISNNLVIGKKGSGKFETKTRWAYGSDSDDSGEEEEHQEEIMEPDFSGAVALANGIKNSGALATITFGDEQAATMKADMTDADLSGKKLGVSGAIIVAAFFPKCQ